MVHDAIRRRQAAAGLPVLLARVLQQHACGSDEALWACLFCLAVLIKDGSGSMRSQVLRRLAAAGVMEALTGAMDAFKVGRRVGTCAFGKVIIFFTVCWHSSRQRGTPRRRR